MAAAPSTAPYNSAAYSSIPHAEFAVPVRLRVGDFKREPSPTLTDAKQDSVRQQRLLKEKLLAQRRAHAGQSQVYVDGLAATQ